MLKSLHLDSLQSPRLQLVPGHHPGLHLQNKGRHHSWRSGRQVMIRSQVATAELPPFFHLAAPGAAGRLCRAGMESSTQSRAPDCHHCQSCNRCSRPDEHQALGTSFCYPSPDGISIQCRPGRHLSGVPFPLWGVLL